MDLDVELTAITLLIEKLSEPIPQQLGAATEWDKLRSRLEALVEEAKVLSLPWGLARQYMTRLRRHIGAVLRMEPDEGHSPDQHLSWARGDLAGLRTVFRPALDRLKEGPSGAVH